MTAETLTGKFSEISGGLYRIAYYILESQTDAEDAVQDLFVKLWSSRNGLDSVLNFKAYCTTLIKNQCIDQLRRNSIIACSELKDDVQSSVHIDDSIDAKEKLAKVMGAIDRLPARQRDVIRMYILEDMPYDEISKRTGMSNLTLRVLLSNARKSLRESLYETN